MPYHSDNSLKASRRMGDVKLGRIQIVVKNPSSDPRPEVDGKAASFVAPTGQNGSMLDLAWSKDIRDFYNAVMQEPVPQTFLDLLAKIAPGISD